jgi:hypothetical protein
MESFVKSASLINTRRNDAYVTGICSKKQRMFMFNYKLGEYLTLVDAEHNIYFLLLMAAVQGEI